MDAAGMASGCRCGAGPEAIDEQGFCTECGRKCRQQARDHVELALAPHFGGVTDRGRRHPQNEDDFALALEMVDDKPVYILVVCDGVSSSENAQTASAAACATARDALLQAVRAGQSEPQEALAETIRAANRAVCTLPYTPEGPKDPPETTLVAALVQNGVVTIGWVGDSRAYWFGPEGDHLLTHDHSWINAMVDIGQMTAEEATQDAQAHAITRSLGLWEGAISEEASEPSLITFALPSSGCLLLCTDGLWNYAPQLEQIAALLRQTPEGTEAQTLARTLVAYANAQGGRDNITVALVSFGKG
jgi:serine/threonine protein phosphatase PrpC